MEPHKITMASSLTIFLIPLLFSFSFSSASVSPKVGVCYGQLGNNLPTPPQSAVLLKSLGAKRVKLYDANPSILQALENTDIQVTVMVPNQLLPNISGNQTLSDLWIKDNILPFYPQAKIRYILIGNEILSKWNFDQLIWDSLVPAMRRIRSSVKKFNLHKIKVGTPCATDVLESSFPPSNGTFRSDISAPIIKPLLDFLNRTKSYFFVDVYTFFPWTDNPVDIKLDYALLSAKNITYTDPVSGLTYNNLFDQILDACHFAMVRLGYPGIRLFVAETGWPSGGDIEQTGVNIYNAATYNRNVVKKFTAKPPVGTPARPGAVIPALIFALYNENQKTGPGTERHFGLLYPNGSHVYQIDLTGQTPESEFKPLPKPTNNVPYKGKIWCVAVEGANMTELVGAISYACGQGNNTCDQIQPGGKCFKPDSLVAHSSYAFSSYWVQFKKAGGSCYFNGLATQTTKDPSYGSCKFPSITV